MRMSMLAATLAAVLLPATAATAVSREAPPIDPKLEKVLMGRVAGKPVSCISLTRARSTRIYDGAIVYEDGKTWYVNRPDKGRCTPLRPNRAIVSRTPGTQLCRGDIITIIDPPIQIPYGACGLDAFVPYTK